MTGRRHRFDAVLKARRAQEDVARLRLASANRELQQQRETLDAETSRYLGQAAPTGSCGIGELLADRQRSERLAASVALARVACLDAEHRSGLRRAEWSEAAQRVAALERLVERRHQEWTAEVQRREDMAVDDLVTSRWAPGRAQGGIRS